MKCFHYKRFRYTKILYLHDQILFQTKLSNSFQNGISKLAKENLVSEQNNIRPSTSFPFLPPPPPLRLSQPKSSTTDLNISPAALEQNIIAAKNAAAMMKLQATINANDEITVSCI